MLNIVVAGGWLMLPIILCSALTMAIVVERAIVLRRRRVLPRGVFETVQRWAHQHELDDQHVNHLRRGSPLGCVLAAALDNRHRAREVVKEAVEDTGRHVAHELDRHLITLGTLAGVSPLLGLLGTVIGMIKVFSAITIHGVGKANELAGGISEAMITTAAGLTVAIPAYFFYRYFRGRVTSYIVLMEAQALALMQTLESRGGANDNLRWG